MCWGVGGGVEHVRELPTAWPAVVNPLHDWRSQAGPAVMAQFPAGELSASTFESTHEYIIPKPELCNRIVTV